MTITAIRTHAKGRLLAAEDEVHRLCLKHSVTFLRVALGAVFILFGALKFFPDLSPAQAVAEMTTEKLTLGLVPPQTLLVFVAVVEVGVGLCLVANHFMRFALWALAFEMLAILSPLVLLSGELFSGPHHLPSLLGQYILKDFVLLGAVLVLFTMQRNDLRPIAGRADDHRPLARRTRVSSGGARPGVRTPASGSPRRGL